MSDYITRSVMRSLRPSHMGVRDYKDKLSGFRPTANSLAGRLREALSVEPDPPDTRVVYFVKSGGRIKIGCSDNIAVRLRALVKRYPHLSVIAIVRGGYASEAASHIVAADYRITRDWFHWSPDLEDAIIEAVA